MPGRRGTAPKTPHPPEPPGGGEFMDGNRFDAALRHLGSELSRRGAARALTSTAVGFVLSEALQGSESEAKSKCASKCKKRNRTRIDHCECECTKCKKNNAHVCRRKCSKKCLSGCSSQDLTGLDACLCDCGCRTSASSRNACRTACHENANCPGVTCPAGHRVDLATCGCVSDCPAGQEYCNGACQPGCPAGTARNPVSCVCCLPTGSSCGPLPPAAPCCFPASTGACGAANTCAGQTTGQPCQFSGQCQPGVNCVSGVCTPA